MPGASVTVIANGSPSAQHSLLIDHEHARAVAEFLRDHAELKLDFCSLVTGVDWPDTETTEKVKVKKRVAGPDGVETEQEVEETRKTKVPGYLEAVYHLFSMEKKHGPVVLRMRTANRVRQPAAAVADAGMAERGVSGARGVRPVRHCLRRPSGPAAHPDVGGLRRIIRCARIMCRPDDDILITGVRPMSGQRGRTWSRSPGPGEILEVSMGPHHPSTHGVFRMDVRLDGERVVRLKPVFGYLHRNHEKIAEHGAYLSAIPYTDRLDYLCSMTNNWGYVLAVEKLAGIAVPERAEYIRVIVAELTRLPESRGPGGFSAAGYGRQRHAADVRLPRAGKDSGSVRVAERRAHDVQLHALWRRARGLLGGVAGRGAAAGGQAAAVPGRVRKPAAGQRDSDGAHPGRRACCRASWPSTRA